jgi:hypothetical protein
MHDNHALICTGFDHNNVTYERQLHFETLAMSTLTLVLERKMQNMFIYLGLVLLYM